jgi:hypothetical protein
VETAYHFVERDGETFVRHHERRLGAGVYLRQRERNRANVVYLTPAFIDVDEVKGLDLQAACGCPRRCSMRSTRSTRSPRLSSGRQSTT